MTRENQMQKYNRIPTQMRNKLLKMIYLDGIKIKAAATKLNLNYSTAKTILHNHRYKNNLIKDNNALNNDQNSSDQQSSVKTEDATNKFTLKKVDKTCQFQIISTQGGFQQSQNSYNHNQLDSQQSSIEFQRQQLNILMNLQRLQSQQFFGHMNHLTLPQF